MKMQSVRRFAFLCSSVAGFLVWTNLATAQCDLYPIALNTESLANVEPGMKIGDVLNGPGTENLGWLTWTGVRSEATLVASLTGNGNSFTYVDPFDKANHDIMVDSWICGEPGARDTKDVRQALKNLESIAITVPVWDTTERHGKNTLYHVAGFAMIQITGYDLEKHRISAVFLGFTDCGGAD